MVAGVSVRGEGVIGKNYLKYGAEHQASSGELEECGGGVGGVREIGGEFGKDVDVVHN